MKPSPQQPTPKQLQRLVPKLAEIIEEWTAKGYGNSTGLHEARGNLNGAQQAIESGHVDVARQRFASAMDYLTSMGKVAKADWSRRHPPKR